VSERGVSETPAEPVKVPGAAFEIREMKDRDELEALLRMRWPGSELIIGGQFVRPEDVESFGAFADGRLHGMATWRTVGRVMHIVAVNAFTDLKGVGIGLIDAMVAHGKNAGMSTLRATITNDNTIAMRFYQKRGFRMTALHPGMIDAMRAIKPTIPEVGLDGIPIHDEVELELDLR
jgi:GNAT superfamily N-acetyltransferase